MSGLARHLGLFFALLVSALLHVHVVKCQIAEPGYLQLNLESMGREIENTICLDISRSDYEVVKEVNGKKRIVKALLLVINGDTLEPEKISSRTKK